MHDQTALRLLCNLSPTLSVGILTDDLMLLGSESSMLERMGVRLVHIDVMDGC